MGVASARVIRARNKIRLEAGQRYGIKLEYRKGNSGAVAELLWKIDSGEKVPGSVAVRVLRADDRKKAATGTVAVDADGRGQDIMDLPDLPDGAYEVEYQFGKVTGRPHGAPGRSLPAGILPFQRIHFPWENNQLGLGHKVYSPYTPVSVKGSNVSVVDRTYAINAFGMFDSVVSKGRELLAGPIAVVCETADGREKWALGKVSGEKKFDDLAVFSCQAGCGALSVDSAVEVALPAKWRFAFGTWCEIATPTGTRLCQSMKQAITNRARRPSG